MSRAGPRKALGLHDLIAVLINQGATIPCYRCKKPIEIGQPIQREHVVPRELAPDRPDIDGPGNAGISHKDCHDLRTYGGPAKATTAGTDRHMIDKARRLEAARLALAEASARTNRHAILAKPEREPKTSSRWGSRPFPKGRGFSQR